MSEGMKPGHHRVDARRIQEVLHAIQDRVDATLVAREDLVSYRAQPTDENLARFNESLIAAYGLPSFIRGNVLTFEVVEAELSKPPAKVTHLEVMQAINRVIERLQQSVPAEGSEIETAVFELETLCASLIKDRTDVRVGDMDARFNRAIAMADEVLSGERSAPATQTLPSPK